MFQKILFKDQLKKLIGDSTTIEFSEQTGFNRTYLSKYLNLRLDRPPSPNLLRAIAGQAVSYEELMSSCGYITTAQVPLQKMVPIPVIGATHAGLPALAVEDIESYEFVESSELSSAHTYFYLRVEGDSMINARICNNDLVFIRRQEDVESGDIAVVIIDNEYTALKRICKKQDTIILNSENPAYAPIVFSKDDTSRLRIIGKVLHVKFKL